MNIKVILWIAMGLGLCVLCGCGSSSTATGSSVSPGQSPVVGPALAAYIARGDAVCREGNEAIAPINARGAEIQRRRSGTAGEAAALVPVLREAVRAYRHFFRRLARIHPPHANAAAVSAIMVGLGRVGGDLERLTDAIARGEPARVKTIGQEREMDHARVSALELEFGFKVCGQPPAQPSVSG